MTFSENHLLSNDPFIVQSFPIDKPIKPTISSFCSNYYLVNYSIHKEFKRDERFSNVLDHFRRMSEPSLVYKLDTIQSRKIMGIFS